jgi:ubiquinone/menaquinone biosynthesis C-methylase UbiE
MATHVCPWWLTYTFDNPLRRMLHDPARILGPVVREGMRVADIGCGMGFFTVALAQLVGPGGRVQAVDLQEQQLARTRARCERAGVAERVKLTRAEPTRLGLEGPLDLVLAFWMVHEVPDPRALLSEVKAALGPAGRLLMAEPRGHVTGRAFAATLALAGDLGYRASEAPAVRISRAVLLQPRSQL